LENQVDAYAEGFKTQTAEQKDYSTPGQFGNEYFRANTMPDPNMYAWQEEQSKLKEPDDAEARKKRAIL
jgi:hypothetical protein